MQEHCLGLLNWHQQRRLQGVPTVSLLVGPERLGFAHWQSWCTSVGRRSATVTNVDDLLTVWLAQIESEADLLMLAVDWLAARQTGSSVTRPNPARMTQYDLDELWNTASIKREDPVASVVYAILSAALSTTPAGTQPTFRHSNNLDTLCGLSKLIPEQSCPTVYFREQLEPQAVLSSLAKLEPIISLLPRLPIAFSVGAEVYRTLQTVNIRSVSILREGEVILQGVSSKELTAQLQQAGVVPLPSPQVLDQLGRGGLTQEAASAYIQFVDELRTV